MAFDLFRIELIVSIKDTTPYSRSMNLDILSVQFIILGYITSTNNFFVFRDGRSGSYLKREGKLKSLAELNTPRVLHFLSFL